MTNYEQYLQDRHTSFVDQRKNLDSFSFQSAAKHDQWLLTLTGGALILSVTFIEKLVSSLAPYSLSFLALSWFLLVGTLFFGFYAIHLSCRSIKRQIEILDEEYNHFRNTTIEKHPEGTNFIAPKNEFISRCELCCTISRITLSIGIFCLCFFSFLNVRFSKEKNISAPNKTATEHVLPEGTANQQIQTEKITIQINNGELYLSIPYSTK